MSQFQVELTEQAVLDFFRRDYLRDLRVRSFAAATVAERVMDEYVIKSKLPDPSKAIKQSLKKLASKTGKFVLFKDIVLLDTKPEMVEPVSDVYYGLHATERSRYQTWELARPVKSFEGRENKNAINEKKLAKTPASKQSYVYYIQWANDNDFVKIGYSSSIGPRLSSFLTGNPRQLILLRVECVNDQLDEISRHRQFQRYHHAGEWFHYRGALKKHVQQLSCDPGISAWESCSLAVRQRVDVEYF